MDRLIGLTGLANGMMTATQQIGDAPGHRPWYRRPVFVLNWLALLLTVGLFVTFLVQAGLFDGVSRRAPTTAPKDITQEKVVVKASSVKGFDQERQPYVVDAAAAAQDPDKPNLITLSQVSAELRKPSGQVISIAADGGIYNSRSKSLDLKGNVRIVASDQFTATMPSATITLENKQLITEDQVLVTMNSGSIMARGLRIVDNGKNITFLQRVRARFGKAASKENREQ